MVQIWRAADRASAPMPYGPLRSIVDVALPANEGWTTHHHRNVEVITLVLSGEMTHKDTYDDVQVIPAGTAHRLSAGVGVTHAEYNLGAEPARFLQLVLDAEIRGVRPEQGTLTFRTDERSGELQPIASGDDRLEGLRLYQDATVYLVHLTRRQAIEWTPEGERRAYLYVYEGDVTIDGARVGAGDGVRIPSGARVLVVAREPAGLLLIDLPA